MSILRRCLFAAFLLVFFLTADTARADASEVERQVTPLARFVTASMATLAPGRDHTVLAQAITDVVGAEPPLFRDDSDKLRTASLIIAVAFREGTLRASVHGDCKDKRGLAIVTPPDGVCERPTSYCSMQINVSLGGSEWLNENPLLCIQKGLATLRTSMRVCPAYPVAWYASGPTGCTNERAQRISRDRVALAHWLWLKRTREGS